VREARGLFKQCARGALGAMTFLGERFGRDGSGKQGPRSEELQDGFDAGAGRGTMGWRSRLVPGLEVALRLSAGMSKATAYQERQPCERP
jgi:hypothetical protein